MIDEYREGIPVAWMLSNREDGISLIPFFEAIKCSSGVITPSWFLSDDADNYFNAWKAVFSEGDTKKILCTWHIDRTWRKALVETVRDKDQIKIYHQISILLNERDEAKFRVTLQAFLTHLQTEHAHFLPTLLQIIAHGYHNGQHVTVLKQQSTLTCTLNHFIES